MHTMPLQGFKRHGSLADQGYSPDTRGLTTTPYMVLISYPYRYTAQANTCFGTAHSWGQMPPSP